MPLPLRPVVLLLGCLAATAACSDPAPKPDKPAVSKPAAPPAVTTAGSEVLQTMREPVEGPAPAGSFVVTGDPRPLEEIEKRYVRHVLGQLGGRRVEAARVLGLSYPTFLKRLED